MRQYKWPADLSVNLLNCRENFGWNGRAKNRASKRVTFMITSGTRG